MNKKSIRIYAAFFSGVLIIVSAACFHAGNKDGARDRAGLIWSDEFDYSGPVDSTRWVYQTGGHGWGNRERQYYRAGTGNAEVKDGKLFITARKEEFEGKPYTSARITTKNRFEVQYGRIVSRIKLPSGQGIWPAFWMLGESIDSAGWPGCGEIDIMEMIGGEGRENTVHGTAHWADSTGKHVYLGEPVTLSEGSFADGFHVFSISWDQEKIIWKMDGAAYHQQDITSPQMHAFHKPFYLLLNLAVGGDWPGYPDSTTVFPQVLEVDYVRVFALGHPPVPSR